MLKEILILNSHQKANGSGNSDEKDEKLELSIEKRIC